MGLTLLIMVAIIWAVCAVCVSLSMITSTLPPPTWTSSLTACSTWTWSRASCENCSAESPVVVPVRPDRSSSSSVSSSASSAASRRSSRNSRVSFSEEVECSNGSIRRLSTNSLIGLKDATSSKQSLSSADENRKSSLKSNLKRKLGSTAEEGFISNLDDDLKQKLEGPAGGAAEADTMRKTSESEGRTKAESQAERAARICDIIVEEK